MRIQDRLNQLCSFISLLRQVLAAPSFPHSQTYHFAATTIRFTAIELWPL